MDPPNINPPKREVDLVGDDVVVVIKLVDVANISQVPINNAQKKFNDGLG